MADFDENAVFDVLRSAIADDVVPEVVLAEAELIPGIQHLEVDVASLLDDVALTRSDEASAVYSFGDIQIRVSPVSGGLAVEVAGVDHPAIRLVVGGHVIDAEVTGSRFALSTTQSGPARVTVTGGGRTIATDWFTLE